MKDKIENILYRLENYVTTTGFKGYDPYDVLNCKFISKKVHNTKIL